MRNWVHVWGTVVCMCAELSECFGNGCLHVCGIGCMFGERLFACMRNWVHVCGIGCMYAELGACLGNGPRLACGVGCMSGSRVLSQAPKLALATGPGPRPRGATLCSKAPAGALLRASRILGGSTPQTRHKVALWAARCAHGRLCHVLKDRRPLPHTYLFENMNIYMCL